MTFEECLRKQLKNHPSMAARDVIKMCYQATFGAEHLYFIDIFSGFQVDKVAVVKANYIPIINSVKNKSIDCRASGRFQSSFVSSLQGSSGILASTEVNSIHFLILRHCNSTDRYQYHQKRQNPRQLFLHDCILLFGCTVPVGKSIPSKKKKKQVGRGEKTPKWRAFLHVF